MPIDDFFLVFRFWGVLFLVGAAAFPLTKRLFSSWWDEGYLFSKAVGMAIATYSVYVLGTVHILPFSFLSIFVSLLIVFLFGIVLNLKFEIFNFKLIKNLQVRNEQLKKEWGRAGVILIAEEAVFFAALLFWSWVKAHEPSIQGLEKFMDYGFSQSILASQYFPARDLWYAGFPINYYYFGHIVMATLTKLSGLDLSYTFNLMLATLFALTSTMSFSIGYQLVYGSRFMVHSQKLSTTKHAWLPMINGLFTSFLVTLSGNMQTIYAFTKGYNGDDVVPFWTILWKAGEFVKQLPEGLNRYWYANATRFIPFSIHEFPSYSFVVSDIHGHVLSLPFVLLSIAVLIEMFHFTLSHRENFQFSIKISNFKFQIIFYGFLVGILLMTNALDGPIYGSLFVFAFLTVHGVFGKLIRREFALLKAQWAEIIIPILIVLGAVGLTSLPFLFHFKAFVTGLAVNCPPEFLANTRFGPILFEGVEKCQKSPLWMMIILWGFFWYCGVWLIASSKKIVTFHAEPIVKLLIVFFVFSLALIIFPEFFYFKDIYPAHFRSNTMFKLGYQAFILFSIVAGYTIVTFLKTSVFSGKVWTGTQRSRITRMLFFIFLIPQLFLVSIYPIFSVRSYFGRLQTYTGIWGLGWFAGEFPDDYAAIQWLKEKETCDKSQGTSKTTLLSPVTCLLSPVIVEADGDSYTSYARFSTFTGIPTVIGWAVHEWLWRGGYDVVAPRREDTRLLYESEDMEETQRLLARYGVRYVIVGSLERQKYERLAEWKFTRLGKLVFHTGITNVYEIGTY